MPSQRKQQRAHRAEVQRVRTEMLGVRRALEQAGVQVKHVAGEGFTSRRPAEKQGHLAICNGLFGQVIVFNQNVFAVEHKFFTHSSTCIWSDI